MGNHDGSRMPTRMGREKTDLYNALVIMLPGTSVTYYVSNNQTLIMKLTSIIQQGEEIGMTDVCITVNQTTKEYLRCNDTSLFPFMREFCRTPFQWDDSPNSGFSSGSKTWLPLAENYQRVNVKEQKSKRGSHLEIYKSLMHLKKSEAAVEGSLLIEALSDDVLMIRRNLNDTTKESLISIFNFGSRYVHLGFINESQYLKTMNVNVSRLNSFHDIG